MQSLVSVGPLMFVRRCNWTHSMQCLRTEVLLLSGIIDKSSRIKFERQHKSVEQRNYLHALPARGRGASKENKFKLKTSPSFCQISLREVNGSNSHLKLVRIKCCRVEVRRPIFLWLVLHCLSSMLHDKEEKSFLKM